MYFYCSKYIASQFYDGNKAPRGIVVYCQYTTAKGCIQALLIASCIRTALSRAIFAIYHTPSGLIVQF